MEHLIRQRFSDKEETTPGVAVVVVVDDDAGK